jgi:hypothetical protein
MPSYTYASADHQVVAGQGTYLVRRDDVAGYRWQVDLGATPGTPYVSTDDASVYALLSNNKLTKRTMAAGARDGGFNGGSDVTVSSASIAGDIVVLGGYVLVGSTTGVVTRYDADGTLYSSYNTGSGASIDFPLVAQSNALYVAPATNKLYARNSINLNTVKWTIGLTLGGTNTSAPYVDKSTGKIYVGATNDMQRITDNGSSGSIDWTYDAQGAIRGGPIPYNGYVYFGRDNGRYYCISEATRSDASPWPYKSASGNASAGPWIDVTSAQNQVIFGTDAGDMHAFNTK